jgi:hypothetical protein
MVSLWNLGGKMTTIATASLSDLELTLLTVLFGVTVFLCATFLAYTILGKKPEENSRLGRSGAARPVPYHRFVAYGVIIVMSVSVISSAAGLPALTGLVGFLLGKAPGSGKIGP